MKPPTAAVILAALALASLRPGPLPGQEAPPTTDSAPDGRAATRPLTLAEAARMSLERHPSIRETLARVRAAEAEVDEARAARLPSVQLSGSATRYQEPMVVTPIHGFTPGQTPPFDRTLLQGSATATYTLWDGGVRGARIGASRSRASATRTATTLAEQGLLTRVSFVYLEILSTNGVLGAHDRRVQALESELERVEALAGVGRASRVERLRVESALAGAEAERVDVEADLRLAEAELARLIGASPDDVTAQRLREPSPPPAAPPSPDSARDRAVAASPELARARREIEAAEAAVSVARRARRPRIELGGRLLHWGSDADPAAATEWSAGVQVAVPVFTGGAIGDRVARAEAERDAARERLRLRTLEAAREVDEALSAHRRAQARSRSLESRVRNQAEVARIEALRLETGTGTQSEYLDAESELFQARARLARARHAILSARIQLARAQGTLTLDWLERTMGGER